MSIHSVVFDLDGTLVKSHNNIYKTMTAALDELKIQYSVPPDEFLETIGLHFADIFSRFGISVPDFEKFIAVYKSLYFEFINESELYPGVREAIDLLKEKEIKISLLTTKMQDQAEKILSHFKLENNFNYIMGRRAGIAHKPSAEPLLKICGDLGISPANTLMVGDSEMDVQCGKNAGTKTCAVTFGYRSKESLMLQYPDFIIDNLSGIGYILNEIRT